MRTIRDYKDIIWLEGREPHAVIWGAGEWGRRLLQKVRVDEIKNVRVYDTNDLNTKDIEERISLEQIKLEAGQLSFIIAVANENAVSEIYDHILNYNDRAKVYRYIPEDYSYISKHLREDGFFNGRKMKKVLDDLSAKQLLEDRIESKDPFFCSRWGSVEGDAVYADLAGVFSNLQLASLKDNAGFYPLDRQSIHKFAGYSASAAEKIDILICGCWCSRVEELYRFYSSDAKLVSSSMMYPFWTDTSWTKALRGKKVLAIHPFAGLMKKQYTYRNKLFESPDILPEMNLAVYQAVQSINGDSAFESWFAALDKMKSDVSRIDFDIALIGCGAYGMPLGAFIKTELRKKAVHLGGSLQILFGIKGKRWENASYNYQNKLYNEYWTRPTEDLKPKGYENVENGCYW